MGANTQNPDIYAYQMGYSYLIPGSFEFGYMFLERIFNFFNFDYSTFRMIISLVGILLIHHTVKLLIKNQSPFYLLYFIYPFLMDVVQIRNFLAMAIFIFAIPFLLSENIKDIIKYILLVLIAASIQVTFVVYIPLFIIPKIKKTVFLKFLIGIGIIFLVLIALNQSGLNLISQLMINTIGSFDDEVLTIAYKQTNLGFILFWAIQSVNFILLYWANKNYIPSKNNKKINKWAVSSINPSLIECNSLQFKYIDLIFWINVYAFLFLPLYVFWSTFSRLMRNIIPLNLLVYIIVGKSLPPRSIKKIGFISICITYNCILFFIEIYMLYGESIINSIFKYNYIFG